MNPDHNTEIPAPDFFFFPCLQSQDKMYLDPGKRKMKIGSKTAEGITFATRTKVKRVAEQDTILFNFFNYYYF